MKYVGLIKEKRKVSKITYGIGFFDNSRKTDWLVTLPVQICPNVKKIGLWLALQEFVSRRVENFPQRMPI